MNPKEEHFIKRIFPLYFSHAVEKWLDEATEVDKKTEISGRSVSGCSRFPTWLTISRWMDTRATIDGQPY
jgi:hypothetical protein